MTRRWTGDRCATRLRPNDRACSLRIPHLTHLRPGEWTIQQITGRDRTAIARFEQPDLALALTW